VRRDEYRWEVVARELDRLLGDGRYAARAREMAERLAEEDGVSAACSALFAD
jgi:UDP:flavonoid glycosyltransferase YjiC (YdhE family)